MTAKEKAHKFDQALNSGLPNLLHSPNGKTLFRWNNFNITIVIDEEGGSVYFGDGQKQEYNLQNQNNELQEFDLTTESYREYDIVGREEPYRITNPQKLFLRTPGGTTHRVLDDKGRVHCIPFGEQSGTVLIWLNKDKVGTPCEF